jgi:hypothetical protein
MKLKISLFIIISILALAGISYGLVTIPYSQGVRSGTLVKLSKKGVLYSTYEGTLDLGSGDQLTWNFSIHNKDIGEKLVSLSGKKVKLNYDELFFKLFYETKYNVKDFSLIRNDEYGDSICELVNVLRKFPRIVEVVGKELKDGHPEILRKVRACQD